ncbi:hypothetical protein O181_081249 [Austropuccinia psidii MF-1]|uniref:Uncharacterized protein n=1 Tax=Austropuccinia psidii MF-1 TaxID=1389203 RepID=A0A9Q3FMH3_9BASI|nr:hypothetical protein [Austropuccinia psidii MF-1]
MSTPIGAEKGIALCMGSSSFKTRTQFSGNQNGRRQLLLPLVKQNTWPYPLRQESIQEDISLASIFSSSKDVNNPVDLSSLNIQDNDIVSQADKQAESLNRFSLLTDKIQPKLFLDGSNFNIWSRAITDTWASCFFGDCDYFDNTKQDTNYQRNLVALSFIRNSIDRSLFQSIISQLYMLNARSVYQSLKKRFGKSSWLAIVHQACCIFVPTNQSSNLVNRSVTVQGALASLQSQVGALTLENLLPIILYFSAPQLQGQITTALDTRKAINPSIEIYANDILNFAN